MIDILTKARALRAYNAYDAEAKREGWAVFLTDDARLRIQTLDDPPEDAALVWPRDIDAQWFVKLRALDGSVPHRAAWWLHLNERETA